MSHYFLGIDAGSSATKWAVVDDGGKEITRGKSIPVDGHIYRDETRKQWNQYLSEIQEKIQVPITAIYAGVTGASDFPEENSEIANLIKEKFPAAHVHVVIDVALGYQANVRNSRGVYLYAGTGSIAVYKDSLGRIRTIGGWGYLLGDEGAGYWIGISALREILADLENGSGDSRLSSIVNTNGQTPTFNQIKELVYGSPRNKVAALAKEVIELAKTGDQKSLEIIKSAARELATLVQRTREAIGDAEGPVVFGGGIAQASQEIVDETARILGTTIQVSSDDLSLEAAQFAAEDFSTTN